MRLWACAAGVCALLLGCDPTVVVGYGAVGEGAAPHDASAPGDASAAMDASRLDAAMSDAGPQLDAGPHGDASDGDAVIDAGPPPPVTWLTGAHAGNDLIAYTDFATWRGRPLDLAALFPDRTSWQGITEPTWPVDMFDPFPGTLLLSLPLYPEDGVSNNADCAAGMYDADWARLGTFLVGRGRGDSILRLGWGFNDTDHPWQGDTDPTPWIDCYRHAVDAIRSTGPELRFDWSFNPVGPPAISLVDPYAFYPGDPYVDFVGIELFDEYPPALDAEAFRQKLEAGTGLDRLAEFARQHGKRVGIAEWAVVSCGSEVGGDNPFFIESMFETFASLGDLLAYESYFEDGTADVCSELDANPEAAARYRTLYGPR